MRNLLNYLIILVLVSGNLSCTKDFLKPEPLSFFAPENVYVDQKGFESLLVTMRKSLANESTGDLNLMYHQWAVAEGGVATLQLDLGRLTPNSDTYSQFVGQINSMYIFIKNANVLISRIDKVAWEDPSVRNRLLAEAFWHRSYWYYRLIHNYGDVPFVGEEILSAKLDFNTHSRGAILNKIQSDMEYAVEHLPENAIPGAISKGAGNHLLAKIYLANAEFDKAVTTASKVINGPYALMKSRFGVDAGDSRKNVIWDLHRPENKNLAENKENILSIVDRFEAPEGAKSSGLWTMRSYHPAWHSASNRDSQGNLGMVASGALYDSLGRGNPNVTLTDWFLYEVWNEKGANWRTTTDLRRADVNWKDVHEMRYNNPASVNYGQPWRFEWVTGDPYFGILFMFAMPIYKTMVPQQNPGAVPMGGNGDWYIFRLAETYLLRAEANFWKGDLASAANDINEIRARAKAPLITEADVTIDFIFDERARELFVEDPRHNEMVRVSYIMANKGLNGYSKNTLHQRNWYYDRVVRLNPFYPQYTGPLKKMISLGLDYPIGSKLSVVGLSPNIEPHNFLWPIDDKIINSNTLGTVNQNQGYVGHENNKPPLEEIK